MLNPKRYTLHPNLGFTLIELLVVIAIIGLLSTIAVVSLNSAREKGRDAKRVADIRQIQTALELYNDGQNGNGYPTDTNDGAGGLNLGSTDAKVLSKDSGFSVAGGGTGDIYMGLIPADPLTSQNYAYVSKTAAGADCDAGPCARFEIAFTLEGSVSGLSGALCASEAGIVQGATCSHWFVKANPLVSLLM